MTNTKKLNLVAAILIGVMISLIYKSFPELKDVLGQLQTQVQVSPSPSIFKQPIATGSAQVTRVVDGDTIEVMLVTGEKAMVRFIGVNTPETVDPNRGKQCFGQEASDEVKSLLSGQIVTLEKDVSETDKYGRLLRYIYLPLPDGQVLFVNDYLVRQGFAQVSTYPPDVKFTDRFLDAQRVAQQAKSGLWSKCEVIQ